MALPSLDDSSALDPALDLALVALELPLMLPSSLLEPGDVVGMARAAIVGQHDGFRRNVNIITTCNVLHNSEGVFAQARGPATQKGGAV